MASLTSRLAGWAAGRLKGEKARKKTMEFVDKTGVGQALGFLGDAALLGGAGKLAKAGLTAAGSAMGIGGAGAGAGLKAMPAVGDAITRVGGGPALPPGGMVASRGAAFAPGAASQRIADMARTMGTQAATEMAPMSAMDRIGAAARGVGQYIAKKPEGAAMAFKGITESREKAAERALRRDLQREQLAQSQRQFEQEFGLRRGQDEREVERQRRIAQMLAPLFQRISGGQG
jgi:hypothetical protein